MGCTQDNYRKCHTSENGYLQSAADLGRTFHAKLRKFLEAKLISLSASAWAPPTFAVPKKTPGQIRQVNDYYRLDNITYPDPYYQPCMEETFHRMAPVKYFSVFDMARGIYKVPIASEDHEKNALWPS